MPGPAVHHIVAQRTIAQLRRRSHRGMPAAFLDRVEGEWSSWLYFGCQGPDPLFFNTKDVHPYVREIVRVYLDVVDFIEGIKQAIRDAIPQHLLDAAAKLEAAYDDVARRSVLLGEIEQGLREVRNTLRMLALQLEAGAKDFLLGDWVFGLLTHPKQTVGMYAPPKWWWFDTLHYRRTGAYATRLLQNAKPDSPELAYAIGYLTHFAADTVGHPYVNLICGGPFRTHGQRHKLVENHQDVFAWSAVHQDQDFIESRLANAYVIAGSETALPRELNEFILRTLHEVYVAPGYDYGAPMNSSDLDDTYRLWLKWFATTTNAVDLPKPVPYSLTRELQEGWEQFADNMGDLASAVAQAARGPRGIWDIVKLLATAAVAAVLAAIAIADYLLGTLASLGAAPIRHLLAVAYEDLYNSFQWFHQALALKGLAFPFKKQLTQHTVQHVLNPGRSDSTGASATSIRNGYPYKKFNPPHLPHDRHLVYPRGYGSIPDNMKEWSPSTVAPDSYFASDVFHYIEGDPEFDTVDADFYQFAKSFTESSGGSMSPAAIEDRFRTLAARGRRGGLGSAVAFSRFLLGQFQQGETIPDFNLDGDRGYAFQCWRRVKDPTEFNNPEATHLAVETDPDIARHNVLNTQTDILHPQPEIR
jgi:hypothetical protein